MQSQSLSDSYDQYLDWFKSHRLKCYSWGVNYYFFLFTLPQSHFSFPFSYLVGDNWTSHLFWTRRLSSFAPSSQAGWGVSIQPSQFFFQTLWLLEILYIFAPPATHSAHTVTCPITSRHVPLQHKDKDAQSFYRRRSSSEKVHVRLRCSAAKQMLRYMWEHADCAGNSTQPNWQNKQTAQLWKMF